MHIYIYIQHIDMKIHFHSGLRVTSLYFDPVCKMSRLHRLDLVLEIPNENQGIFPQDQEGFRLDKSLNQLKLWPYTSIYIFFKWWFCMFIFFKPSIIFIDITPRKKITLGDEAPLSRAWRYSDLRKPPGDEKTPVSSFVCQNWHVTFCPPAPCGLCCWFGRRLLGEASPRTARRCGISARKHAVRVENLHMG